MNICIIIFVTLLICGRYRVLAIETVDVIVGQKAEVPCNTTSYTDGDSLSVLAWYKDNSETALYSSRDLRDDASGGGGGSEASSGDPRFSLQDHGDETRLSIDDVRPKDAGLYTCVANFAKSPSVKTKVQLNVIEPPQRIWVVQANGSKVATAHAGTNASATIGPYYIGDTVHLFCVAFGGKPRPEISWWMEGELVKNSSTPLSEHRARSDLTVGPLARDSLQRTLACRVANNALTAALIVEVTIDMILLPELVSVRRSGVAADVGTVPVRAGEPVLLQCRVLGAYPDPEIVWKINDDFVELEQNVTSDPGRSAVASAAWLTAQRAHDEAAVSCCAASPARRPPATLTYTCSPPHPLTVYYPPILEITSDYNIENGTITVVNGSCVTLNCTYMANPEPYELIWYHEEEVLTAEPAAGASPGSLLQPQLSAARAGEYSCAAANNAGAASSDPVTLRVLYPPYCEDAAPLEYGVSENEPLNVTCHMNGEPPPAAYRWVVAAGAVNASALDGDRPYVTHDTRDNVLVYVRPNDTVFTTILCWGINEVLDDKSVAANVPCTIWVTDETAPRPPSNCLAKKAAADITVTCDKGHDGGLPQKFVLTLTDVETEQQLISIVNLEPRFLVQEPTQNSYKFHIVASNGKGESTEVVISKDDIVGDLEERVGRGSVADITTLALALCGGVLLLALCACALVLAAHAPPSAPTSLSEKRAPLAACNTDESNCETCNSDDGSEYNLRRTESFRKAVSRCPSRNYTMRRTGSFHSPRCLGDETEVLNQCNDHMKHPYSCRVHSMQNICRRKDADTCDHMVFSLPQEHNYSLPRPPVNTFYTMPRKNRQKLTKEMSDEISEVTQNSDGFSLPPPPDEFLGYKVGIKIKDLPTKATPTYSTIRKINRQDSSQFNNVVISPLNTVGLPASSGDRRNLYACPDVNEVNKNPFDTE